MEPTTEPSIAPSSEPTLVPTPGCLGNNIWDMQKKLGEGLPSYNFPPLRAGEKSLPVASYTGTGADGAGPDSTLKYHLAGLAFYLGIDGYLQFDVSQIIFPASSNNNKDIIFHFTCPVGGVVSLYETDNYGGSIPSTASPQYRGKVAVPSFWNCWGWGSSKTKLSYKITGSSKYVKVKATNKCYVEYVNQVCI